MKQFLQLSAALFLFSTLFFSCTTSQKNDNDRVVMDSTSLNKINDAMQQAIDTNKNQAAAPITKPDSVSSPDGQITIRSFSEFPPEVDGCSCSYSMGEQKRGAAEQYIYADDLGKNAFMIINGTMTKFVFSKSDTTQKNRSVNTFTNEHYEVTIDVIQTGQGEESQQQEGTLKLKDEHGKEMTVKITGECGC